jgi:ferric-dicitrate binding protein FerR (iron transport regulator)
MVDHKRIANLLLKKLGDELSPAEEIEVEAWLSQGDNRAYFDAEMKTGVVYGWLRERLEMDERSMDRRFYAMLNRKAPVRRMISPRRWVAAASVLVLLGAGAVIFYRKPVTVPVPIEENQMVAAKAIRPGTNKAHLQLSNGAVIELDTAKDGSIAFQGASNIVKNGSTISYSAAKGAAPMGAYNVLATPRAGQFQMVLPDGTKVWLNNASTLKYPVDFSGDRRQVELSGEAYFEVAKSAGKPFRVVTPGAGIEVLGTSFNVSSYVDEQSQKTTLVEGKVRVTSAGDNLILTPGEQAEASNGKLSVNHPDVYRVTAWRRGFFNFSNADIQTVMRQIARWYDVTVVYEGEPSKEKLEGSISRNQNLAETLAALDALHIHATVKDRTVTVHP